MKKSHGTDGKYIRKEASQFVWDIRPRSLDALRVNALRRLKRYFKGSVKKWGLG